VSARSPPETVDFEGAEERRESRNIRSDKRLCCFETNQSLARTICLKA